MKTLTVKDIRDVLSNTLFDHYSLADFAVRGTTVKDKEKEFRIEFRIYDTEFWMDINADVDFIHIAASDSKPIKTIHFYLPMFEYNKENFDFGWRTDLECFFDTFKANLFEKLEQNRKAAVERCNTRNDTPVKITLEEGNLMNYLEKEEAASYEEYMAEAKKKADEAKTGETKSVLAQCIDAIYGKPSEAKTTETKPSIFNSLKDENVEW